MNVSVTNKNDEDYARKFDGKLYEFPVGKAVVIPDVAAQYLFAYGQDDAARQKILVRNGWQKNGAPGLAEGGPIAAMKRLQNFVFKAAPDDEPRAKPSKVVTEGVKQAVAAGKQARVPGGIGAISAHAKDDGRTILPRPAASGATGGTIHLPGKAAPLAPPA
jgi:hypothetical protein